MARGCAKWRREVGGAAVPRKPALHVRSCMHTRHGCTRPAMLVMHRARMASWQLHQRGWAALPCLPPTCSTLPCMLHLPYQHASRSYVMRQRRRYAAAAALQPDPRPLAEPGGPTANNNHEGELQRHSPQLTLPRSNAAARNACTASSPTAPPAGPGPAPAAKAGAGDGNGAMPPPPACCEAAGGGGNEKPSSPAPLAGTALPLLSKEDAPPKPAAPKPPAAPAPAPGPPTGWPNSTGATGPPVRCPKPPVPAHPARAPAATLRGGGPWG